MTLAAAILAALMAQASAAGLPADCPRVSLSYAGGLSFEDRGGLVFAVWDSGAVVRAAAFDAPDKAHVVGTAPPGDVRALVDAAMDSTFWQGEALLALDLGYYTLRVQRADGTRLGRSETRDARLSPALETIRQRAFDVALGDTRRISVPIDEGRWQCPGTIQKDE